MLTLPRLRLAEWPKHGSTEIRHAVSLAMRMCCVRMVLGEVLVADEVMVYLAAVLEIPGAPSAPRFRAISRRPWPRPPLSPTAHCPSAAQLSARTVFCLD